VRLLNEFRRQRDERPERRAPKRVVVVPDDAQRTPTVGDVARRQTEGAPE
jgi:hypothetical protein